ncbi:MAG: hypothetical protein EB059_03145 [Alphaproteobacteria bacterium]|nr:hypothetical protein [Alphaproteobacteria bacterium]
MNTKEEIGNAFLSSLIKLRDEKGDFNALDVGELFEQISAMTDPSKIVLSQKLSEEVGLLLVFIEKVKNEISAIGVPDSEGKIMGDASLHLDAVIKASEEAGHAIMDAVDAIQTAANAIGGEHQKAIGDAITKIYEACNFQDITSQRVNKVIKVLSELDVRVNNTLKLLSAQTMSVDIEKEIITDDRRFLNGPQLPDKAPSQADIDALFGKV